ncbi:22663_t:CDS:2, partial [Racocetra persica]
ILLANHIKKGYYIHRIKEGLWSTFGISKNKKDACASSANLQVGSLDSIDVNDLYENLPDSNSESHLSDNGIEDNDNDDNYDP